MQTRALSAAGSMNITQTSLISVEETRISTTQPASLSTEETSQRQWLPVDSVLYEDADDPVEEVPRYPNVLSLYPDWHREANCLGESDSLFFGASNPDTRPPYTLGDIKKAKTLCRSCPVAVMCLRSALTNREEYGVWAGTTRRQRRRILDAIDAGESTIDAAVAEFEARHGQR